MMGDDLRDALISIGNTLAFSSRDWAANHRDAWLWGIVHGWDDAAMRELVVQYGWTPETVTQLRRLHTAFAAARQA